MLLLLLFLLLCPSVAAYVLECCCWLPPRSSKASCSLLFLLLQLFLLLLPFLLLLLMLLLLLHADVKKQHRHDCDMTVTASLNMHTQDCNCMSAMSLPHGHTGHTAFRRNPPTSRFVATIRAYPRPPKSCPKSSRIAVVVFGFRQRPRVHPHCNPPAVVVVVVVHGGGAWWWWWWWWGGGGGGD